MTGTRDSTHVDTVGEKWGGVVLNLGLREERDWLSMMDRAIAGPSR